MTFIANTLPTLQYTHFTHTLSKNDPNNIVLGYADIHGNFVPSFDSAADLEKNRPNLMAEIVVSSEHLKKVKNRTAFCNKVAKEAYKRALYHG